jgi:long-chain acyl-CoA synthetase
MMIVGGENVFPREIEEVLNRHPSVHASAVIGRSCNVRGELPVAFVELEDGAAFDEAALKSHCKQSLAGYKIPRDIRVLDQLPRNPTGKIMRRALGPIIEADSMNA